jgi:glycosyltransferase involved in cell wall biosynthesis
MSDSVDVVIPARNEQETIGRIVSIFRTHPAIGKIIVAVDSDTGDDTAVLAEAAIGDMRNGWVLPGAGRGKGQCVRRGMEEVSTDYVIFCDADLTGLTADHVSRLILEAVMDTFTMTIGVPDVPSNCPIERIWAWPWVSGERCVPTALIRPLFLHGYLMETQINQAAQAAGIGVHFEWLRNLKSSYYMSERRIREMERDRHFGIEHGILL